jgi:hypothetical protein
MLTGQVRSDEWSVLTATHAVEGGYECEVRIEHSDGRGNRFEHCFRHEGCFANEHDAMLAGLRAGMVWIDLKVSGTIGV